MDLSRYPRLRLSEQELFALPEYSCSLPTGTTIGKRWRRHEPYRPDDPVPRRIWVGEYFDIGEPDKVGICWYRPLIRVQAIHEPERPAWLLTALNPMQRALIEARSL
jgi:hypothetical protein